MSWEDEDQREDWEWSQPWEDEWPESLAGPEYAMAAWCLVVMLDDDFYAPRARWASDR